MQTRNYDLFDSINMPSPWIQFNVESLILIFLVTVFYIGNIITSFLVLDDFKYVSNHYVSMETNTQNVGYKPVL